MIFATYKPKSNFQNNLQKKSGGYIRIWPLQPMNPAHNWGPSSTICGQVPSAVPFWGIKQKVVSWGTVSKPHGFLYEPCAHWLRGLWALVVWWCLVGLTYEHKVTFVIVTHPDPFQTSGDSFASPETWIGSTACWLHPHAEENKAILWKVEWLLSQEGQFPARPIIPPQKNDPVRTGLKLVKHRQSCALHLPSLRLSLPLVGRTEGPNFKG